MSTGRCVSLLPENQWIFLWSHSLSLNEMTIQGSSLGRSIEHILKYENESSHNQQVFLSLFSLISIGRLLKRLHWEGLKKISEFFSGLSLPLSELNRTTSEMFSFGKPIELLLEYENKFSHTQQASLSLSFFLISMERLLKGFH